MQPEPKQGMASVRAFSRVMLVVVLALTVFVMLIGFGLGVEDYRNRAEAQQTVCGVRESLVERLEVRFKEIFVAYGLTGNGMVVEVYVSAHGSWTLVLTRPDGIACLMAAGQNWEYLPPDLLPGEEEGA